MAERAVEIETPFTICDYEKIRNLSELDEWVRSILVSIKEQGKYYKTYGANRDIKKFYDEAIALRHFANFIQLPNAKYKLNYDTDTCDACMFHKDKKYFVEFGAGLVDGESDAIQREYLANNLENVLFAPLLGEYKAEGSKHKGNRRVIAPSIGSHCLIGIENDTFDAINNIVEKKKNNKLYGDLKPIIIVIGFHKKFDWEEEDLKAFQDFYDEKVEPFNSNKMQFTLMDYSLGRKPERIFVSDNFESFIND
tara:strand:- start:1011 stop:1766 length:756 start_codon:yes stop_codon:yes gene_type:complete